MPLILGMANWEEERQYERQRQADPWKVTGKVPGQL